MSFPGQYETSPAVGKYNTESPKQDSKRFNSQLCPCGYMINLWCEHYYQLRYNRTKQVKITTCFQPTEPTYLSSKLFFGFFPFLGLDFFFDCLRLNAFNLRVRVKTWKKIWRKNLLSVGGKMPEKSCGKTRQNNRNNSAESRLQRTRTELKKRPPAQWVTVE